MLNRFDEMLLAHDMPDRWKRSLIDVADTAFLCWIWLEERKIPFTAADVLTMTKMVIDREADGLTRERGEGDEAA